MTQKNKNNRNGESLSLTPEHAVEFFFYGSPFKPVDPLNVTSCGFETSNFTQVPLQPSCADSWLKLLPLSSMANEHPYRARKELHCQKRRSYMARRPLSKPICAKEERNGLPSADQGLSTAKPRSSHAVCTLQMHPPTSPCPALSAKIKDKAGCDKRTRPDVKTWI